MSRLEIGPMHDVDVFDDNVNGFSYKRLQAAAILAGVKPSVANFARIVGMHDGTFRKRIHDGRFTREQIIAIVNALHLTSDEMIDIFYRGLF